MTSRLFATLWLVCSSASACEDPGSDPPETRDCRSLLVAVERLDAKLDWSACTRMPSRDRTTAVDGDRGPPPMPVESPDPAHCALLDPGNHALDECLLATIEQATPRIADPRCPRVAEEIAIGDLAFYVLVDRHPQLWSASLPSGIATQAAAEVQDWLADPANRVRLAQAARRALRPEGSADHDPDR